jgi:hypothetical protein
MSIADDWIGGFPGDHKGGGLGVGRGQRRRQTGAVVHAGSASNENDQDKIGETIRV